MLKVTLVKNSGFIEMPPIEAGQSGSITDGLNEKTSILIFTCKADDSGAVIHRSSRDNFVNIGNIRALFDKNIKLVTEIGVGQSYEMEVSKKIGTLIIKFEHVATKAKITH
jgi:hypothetical protein